MTVGPAHWRHEMTTCMIIDSDGDKLTDGLQQYDAGCVAQRMANARGCSVWVYGPDDTDDTAERFDPIDD